MSRADYLASKYLTADPSSKKRKRKSKATSGLIIADDDALGWDQPSTLDADDDSRPSITAGNTADFRKAKKSSWKTVSLALQPKDSSEDAAVDKILAAAAEESRGRDDDDAPVVEDEDGIMKMSDGTHAGLQSAAAVAAQFEKRRKEEALAWKAQSGSSSKTHETVYRDATGRRIDISMRRAEAAKELAAKAAKDAAALDAQRGDVQLAAAAARREALAEAKFLPLARGVDDTEMNDEMKEAERWNDPAAQFLSKKEGKGKGKKGGRKVYVGAAAPNRYGIRPGFRWDGVDRGNGWEGERFKALNRVTRNKNLDFSWQEDT